MRLGGGSRGSGSERVDEGCRERVECFKGRDGLLSLDGVEGARKEVAARSAIRVEVHAVTTRGLRVHEQPDGVDVIAYDPRAEAAEFPLDEVFGEFEVS